MRVGPFLRKYPTTTTTITMWKWCYLTLDGEGNIMVIEWISP